MNITLRFSGRTWSLWAAGALSLGLTVGPGYGAGLTLQPPTMSAPLGASFDVTVRIDGLGDGTAPSLGAFDFVLNFDPGVLRYDNVVFGDPLLGDLLGPIAGSLSDFSINPSGSALNLFSVSLDSVADIDALQPGQFTLASIKFSAIGLGSSSIGFSDVILGDAAGAPLNLDSLQVAQVTVVVPEANPVALGGLIMCGVVAGQIVRRRRKVSAGNDQDAD